MVIKIVADKRSFSIPFPSAILLNRITAGIAANIINKKTESIKISRSQLNILFKSINKSKKILRKTKEPLLFVKSSDGEEVIIKL